MFPLLILHCEGTSFKDLPYTVTQVNLQESFSCLFKPHPATWLIV